MPTGPPDQSPPAEADFGPSHDAITAELLDLTWQFLDASPTVRAELGQFLADHGQHPVAGLGAFLDCLQLSAARHRPRDAHGERTPSRSTSEAKTSLPEHASAQRRWGQTPSHLGPEVVPEISESNPPASQVSRPSSASRPISG